MEDIEAIQLLFKFVKERNNASFRLEYGYGISEVPYVTIYKGINKLWGGTLDEFKKWVQS